MLSITSLALGFSPAQKLQVQSPTCSARASVQCGLESVAPRRAVLAAALGLGASGAAPAWAGYVTSLGIVTTSVKDAERDDERGLVLQLLNPAVKVADDPRHSRGDDERRGW